MDHHTPHAGWAQPQAAPQPPKKRKTGKIALGLVGALAAVGIIGAVTGGGNAEAEAPAKQSASKKQEGAASWSGNKQNPPAKDVTLGTFQIKDEGYGLVTGHTTVTIENHTSKRSDYLVTVEYLDASGTRIGEDVASANALSAGQTKQEGLTALLDDAELKKVSKVKVAEVQRWATASN